MADDSMTSGSLFIALGLRTEEIRWGEVPGGRCHAQADFSDRRATPVRGNSVGIAVDVNRLQTPSEGF